MERDRFWELMAPVRAEAGSDVDQYEAVLESQLDALSPEELMSFDRHLDELVGAAYHWKLWAAAYLINGGCSDDGFYYFRAWLVAQGKEIYERAIADPDSLSAVCSVPNEDAECEELLYLARRLYEKKTGREPDPPSHQADNPSPDEPAGESWGEDDLPSLLPRLAAIHWEE